MRPKAQLTLLILGNFFLFLPIWLIYGWLSQKGSFDFDYTFGYDPTMRIIFDLVSYTSLIVCFLNIVLIGLISFRITPQAEEEFREFIEEIKDLNKIQKIGIGMIIIGILLAATAFIIQTYVVILINYLIPELTLIFSLGLVLNMVGSPLPLIRKRKKQLIPKVDIDSSDMTAQEIDISFEELRLVKPYLSPNEKIQYIHRTEYLKKNYIFNFPFMIGLGYIVSTTIFLFILVFFMPEFDVSELWPVFAFFYFISAIACVSHLINLKTSKDALYFFTDKKFIMKYRKRIILTNYNDILTAYHATDQQIIIELKKKVKKSPFNEKDKLCIFGAQKDDLMINLLELLKEEAKKKEYNE